MLHWSLVFLVIALIAAVLGFGGIAGAAAGIAKILFFVFLVVWLVSFLIGRRSVCAIRESASGRCRTEHRPDNGSEPEGVNELLHRLRRIAIIGWQLIRGKLISAAKNLIRTFIRPRHEFSEICPTSVTFPYRP